VLACAGIRFAYTAATTAFFVVTFSMGVTVGAIYEVYEYVFDALGGDLQVSYGDITGDLTDAPPGAWQAEL
jgi:hypothetical protein